MIIQEDFAMTRYPNLNRLHDIRITNMIVPLLIAVLFTFSGEPAVAQEIILDREVEMPEFEEGLVNCAVGSLFRLIEGSFGALVMVVAGLGAIIAASMGAYRASVGMLVVAVGSFILRALVSLFFPSHAFSTC